MGNTWVMPWQTPSLMSQRYEFVLLASVAGANIRELCRRFGISAKTGYKWLGRYRSGGQAALADRSRRPRTSPVRCAPALISGYTLSAAGTNTRMRWQVPCGAWT